MQGNGFDNDKNNSSRNSVEKQSPGTKITSIIKIRN